ncbi:YbaK/EbsC family protein [Subtercola lobariae]|uniref:YbaK/aminoacyl-tRNA synthetase-associated domain-containing protein n=1 Tax=Subtercola lobariae TaxID=1588641 RepID=A0A917B4H8_9MICO|nr:YbaK/EbsC family protein [Subtercola lobariae]GGF21097.1 hypothetical protein GCM10011399_13420 [Subtercola lobariae]
MGTFQLGTLNTLPVSEHPELVSASVFDMLRMLDLTDQVGVVEIDPELSDTAATQEAYGLEAEALANCVIVAGRRDGDERIAACLVSAATRADVNGVVRRRLDVRKASFLARESATELTGMEFGGITPIGLPEGWPVLIDSAVAASALVVIGSGIRRSKLIVPGTLLARLPGAEVIEGLGKPIA